jgi:hypothetical protein
MRQRKDCIGPDVYEGLVKKSVNQMIEGRDKSYLIDITCSEKGSLEFERFRRNLSKVPNLGGAYDSSHRRIPASLLGQAYGY